MSSSLVNSGQIIAAPADVSARPNPKTITLNQSDILDSATNDLHDLLAVERSLVGALKVVQKMIGSERRLIEKVAP